jgi:hypothetical protein
VHQLALKEEHGVSDTESVIFLGEKAGKYLTRRERVIPIHWIAAASPP